LLVAAALLAAGTPQKPYLQIPTGQTPGERDCQACQHALANAKTRLDLREELIAKLKDRVRELGGVAS
jgi:hypothetical protein